MTWNREPERIRNNAIHEAINSKRIIGEAIIESWSDKDKIAKIKVLPEQLTAYARLVSPFMGDKSAITSSPTKGNHALILFGSQVEDEYENIFIIGFIQDKNNITAKENSGNKDPNYTQISHPSGMGLHIFKANDDNKKHGYMKAFDFIKCEATEKYDIVSNNVSLGEANLSDDAHKVVLKSHFDVFNGLSDGVKSLLDATLNQPMLGDLGIPLPISVRNPASLTAFANFVASQTSGSTKEINLNNVASKVRAK